MTSGPGDRELRIVIVTDQFEPMVGGVPTVTRELARGLGERGHAVTVVAPGPLRAPGPRPAAGRAPARPQGEDTAAVRRVPSAPWPWYDGQRLGLLTPARARALIARLAPDVVHVHSPLTLGAAAAAAGRRGRVPVVYTNHYQPANVWPGTAGRGRPRVRDAAFYAYLTGFANRCDQVTAPTATALRLLREHGLRAPSEPVSNGVDLTRFAPGPPDPALRDRYALPPGRPVVLSVGRLSPEKRAGDLIEAMARLGDGAPLLALAGSGPAEGRLRALARDRGVAGQVRFLGFVPEADLPGLYRLADVCATASPAELQSLTTMDAMASGLPVAAVDAGALGELVRPGEHGFLTRPGDPPALAASLRALCGDAGLRARLGRACARDIARHDRSRVLDRWESLYRGLARPGAARPHRGPAAPAEQNRSR